MENKLAITIVALMVLALAAPAVMAATTYTATVQAGQNTAVEVGTGGVAFAAILQGDDKTLVNSLKLTNTGGVAATVTAAFTTNNGTTWGLVDTPIVLPGNNFELGISGNLKPLNFNSATAVDLTPANNVPAGNFVDYDAKLTVPSLQAAGDYSGAVELAFGS